MYSVRAPSVPIINKIKKKKSKIKSAAAFLLLLRLLARFLISKEKIEFPEILAASPKIILYALHFRTARSNNCILASLVG